MPTFRTVGLVQLMLRPFSSTFPARCRRVALAAAMAGATPLTAGVKDGLLDLGFSPEVPGDSWALTAVGDYYYVRSDGIYRLRHDGTIDETFQCPLRADGPFESIAALRPTPDGGLVVAGTFRIGAFDSESPLHFVAKIDSTGAVDSGFINNVFGPPVPAAIVTDCLVDSVGRIYVAGPFHVVNGIRRDMLVRLLPNGAVDPGFVVPSEVQLNLAGMALSADDKLRVVAGFSGDSLVRLNEDGSVDPSFSFAAGYTGIQSIRLSADGRIAVLAYKLVGNSSVGPNVQVFGPSGALDTSFSPDFTFTIAYDLLWDGDRVLVSGTWSEFAGVASRTQRGLIRFNPDGARDDSWTTSAVADLGFRGLSLDARGNVVAVGLYEPTFGGTEQRLVRLRPGAATELKWFNTSARGTVSATEPLIVGFVLGGDAPQRVLVRGVGPSLTQFGIPNPLSQPSLRVFRRDEFLLERTGWWNSFGVREAAEAAGAFPLLSLSQDAADTIILPPGLFTLVVSSADGSSGVALAEVYALDVD